MSVWEVDRAYINAFATAVGDLGLPVEGLEAGPLELLKSPRKQAWWPGQSLVELIMALGRLHGREGLEAITRRASHDGMARLVRPVVVNVLALAGSPPHALFSRVGMFTSIAVRGVTASYERVGDGCELTYTFPVDVPELVSVVWVGQVDLGLSLSGGGRISKIDTTARVHRVTLTFGR